jgi:hypothetical protein
LEVDVLDFIAFSFAIYIPNYDYELKNVYI